MSAWRRSGSIRSTTGSPSPAMRTGPGRACRIRTWWVSSTRWVRVSPAPMSAGVRPARLICATGEASGSTRRPRPPSRAGLALRGAVSATALLCAGRPRTRSRRPPGCRGGRRCADRRRRGRTRRPDRSPGRRLRDHVPVRTEHRMGPGLTAHEAIGYCGEDITARVQDETDGRGMGAAVDPSDPRRTRRVRFHSPTAVGSPPSQVVPTRAPCHCSGPPVGARDRPRCRLRAR